MTTTTKITDLQRKILEAAAAREGGFIWPEEHGLRKGSAVLVVKALLGKGLVNERPARAEDPVWREDADGKPMTVIVSSAGLAAVGVGPPDQPVVEATPPRTPRAGTKLAKLVALLGQEGSATIEELAAATSWQVHTVRGVLSGALVRRFGLMIVSEKIDGRGRTYRARSKCHDDQA